MPGATYTNGSCEKSPFSVKANLRICNPPVEQSKCRRKTARTNNVKKRGNQKVKSAKNRVHLARQQPGNRISLRNFCTIVSDGLGDEGFPHTHTHAHTNTKYKHRIPPIQRNGARVRLSEASPTSVLSAYAISPCSCTVFRL